MTIFKDGGSAQNFAYGGAQSFFNGNFGHGRKRIWEDQNLVMEVLAVVMLASGTVAQEVGRTLLHLLEE
jgi:hypothetical protein